MIGSELGHFKIDAMIAEGGMGIIYKATHSVIGKQAAIKVLTKKYSRDKNMIKRLHREARAVNKIGHPNIIDIFDFGQTEDGREYFVMEYVPGMTLAQVLTKRKRLKWPYIHSVLSQTLDALSAIHDLGFIHRDIKPDNILVIEQEGGRLWTKLLDFGIARSMEMGPDGERLTSAGSMMGTPEYVSPEQIRGRDVDGRADLYAVGVMLFEMVMGEIPYKAGHSEQIISLLMAHLKEPIPPMEDIPVELEIPAFVPAAVTRALSKDPADRFAGAREFAAALEIEIGPGSSGSGVYAPLTEEQVEAMEKSLRMPRVTASTDAESAPTLEYSAPAITGVGQAPPDTDKIPSPVRTSSGRKLIPPLVVLVLSMAAIGIFFLLKDGDKPKPGEQKNPAARVDEPKKTPKALPRVAVKVDLPATYSRVRQVLKKGLRNPRADIRRVCVKGIGELRLRDDLTLLATMLKDDPDRSVQSATALAIAYLGDAGGADAIREVYKSSNQSLKVWLDDALMRLNQADGRKRLRAALKSKDKAVRFQAALALGEAGDRAAMAVLRNSASEAATVNRQTLVAILGTLARLGHPDAYKSLEKALTSADRIMKLGAAEALARLGNEQVVPALQGMLKDKDMLARLVAAKVLATLGDYSGLEALASATRSKEEVNRRMGAEGLGSINDKAALPPLAAALDDKSGLVKATAAESLARILASMPSALVRRSQDWLKTALANREWSVRHAAVGITSEMDPELAVSLLGWAMRDKDARIRSAAVASLGKLRSDKAIPLLTHALDDKSADVRRTAASALGRLGVKKVADVLHTAVRDTSPAVGVAAAGSLLAMGDTSYVKDLKRAAKARNPKLRKAAITALGKWKAAEADKLLVAALDDRSGDVRFAAATQLAQRGKKTPKVVEVLRAAVGKGGGREREALAALAKLGLDPSKEIQRLAKAKAAGQRKSSMEAAALMPAAKALAVLRVGAKDPVANVRLAAAGSLARLAPKHADAARLLRTMTRDPDGAVRVLAAIGLARVGKARARPDMGKVKPVKAAPLPTRKPKPKPKVSPKGAPRPLFVEDTDKQKLYKYHVSQAAVATSRGKYKLALRHLNKAKRNSNEPALAFEFGFQHLKLAIGLINTDKRKARKHLGKARGHFNQYLKRAPGGTLAPKAKKGLADVKRLKKQVK